MSFLFSLPVHLSVCIVVVQGVGIDLMVINESSLSMSTLPTQAITCTASDRRGSANRDRRVHISEVQPTLETRDHENELIESNLIQYIYLSIVSLIFLNSLLRFTPFWPTFNHNRLKGIITRPGSESSDLNEPPPLMVVKAAGGCRSLVGFQPIYIVYAIRRVYSMPIVRKNFRFGNFNRLRSTCWKGYITERIPYYWQFN